MTGDIQANREVQHLVTMANDIAANMNFQAEAGTRIADHINRFWAPRMRVLLLEYASRDGRGISDVLATALSKIQEK